MSTGMWGTLCEPSTSTRAPASCAIRAISATGLIVPSTLLTWTTPTIRVRSVSRPAKASMSSSPPGVTGAKRTVAPVISATICHGTMFEWCSISVTSTSSPAARLRMPQAHATRLIASEAFLVNTTVSRGAPTRRATLSRPAS